MRKTLIDVKRNYNNCKSTGIKNNCWISWVLQKIDWLSELLFVETNNNVSWLKNVNPNLAIDQLNIFNFICPTLSSKHIKTIPTFLNRENKENRLNIPFLCEKQLFF